ncbi:MAG: hypothetical protein ABDH21_05500 [bacterium]
MVGGSNPLRPALEHDFFFILLILLCKAQASQTNLIIYSPEITSDPEKIVASQYIEIYSDQYWIKSSKAIIDKVQKKIIFPEKTYIKNLVTGDELVSSNTQAQYTDQGKIEFITGQKGSGYIASKPEFELVDKLFFEYSNFKIFSNKYIFNNVKFSTCNLDHYNCFDDKHYLLGAYEVEVIPDDKMILTSSKLFLYKKKVLGYRKLIIPLKRKKLPRGLPQEDTSVFPQVGYNEVDGFFIIRNIDYYFSNTNYGRILSKYAQKTGLYYGISNFFSFNIRDIKIETRNYLFVNNNKKYGSGYRNINSDINLYYKNTTAYFRYSSNRSIYRNFVSPLNETISYGITTTIKDININYNANRTSTEGYFSSSNQFLNVAGNFKNLNFTLNWVENSNTYFLTNTHQVNENLNFSLYYNSKLYNISLLIDNTKNNFGFFGVNKLPEVLIVINRPIKYKDRVTLSPSFFIGKYTEPSFKRKTTKYHILVNYVINHIKGEGISWVTTGFFKQNFYNTGKYYADRNFHASYVNSFNSNLSINKKSFRLSINYTYNFGKGFAPIFADFTGTYQNLTANLSVFDNKTFDLNLSTSYNLNRGIISPISINLKYFPSQKFYASIITSYDFRRGKVGNINTNVDWYVTKDIRLTAWLNYNTFTNKIDYIDFVLVKDNHCWVSYLVYRSTVRQFYIYAYLKALPIVGINIGIDRSGKFIPIY